MNANTHPTFQTRPLLQAALTGAVISIVSAVAYPHSGQEMPVVANIIVATASLAGLPGYILTAYITNNIHNANLILAGVINFFLYGGLTLWLLTWRRRKKLAARP